ncbi:MAG: GlsB/YeaQ/YmgE family stress response membrane protein [Planctomycetaceae bacterium]
MSVETIISWIVCGLVVGICARFLIPGRQYMSLPMTAILGIVGAIVGGYLYSLGQGASAQPFSLTSHNWYGWIVSILGAMLVVWIYPFFYPRKWWN